MVDSVLWENFSWIWKVFLILTLISFGVYFAKDTPLKDLTRAHLEIACTKGGFTTIDIEAIKDELSNQGFKRDKINIKTLPEVNNYVYKGEMIRISVEYKDGDIKNRCTRYGMSEKVD